MWEGERTCWGSTMKDTGAAPHLLGVLGYPVRTQPCLADRIVERAEPRMVSAPDGAIGPDLDPVRAHERPLLFPLQPGDDEVGFLERHVAIDAAPLECVAFLGEELAALLLMAGKAPIRQLLRIALRL